MVDVGAKDVTHRVAVASGRIPMQPATFRLVVRGRAKKGDVLGVARIAAIQAAKRTPGPDPARASDRHHARRHRVRPAEEDLVGVHRRDVECPGRTGVEMEALTAAAVGLLTIYDMIKAVDRGMVLQDIRLEEKRGGKSGALSLPLEYAP